MPRRALLSTLAACALPTCVLTVPALAAAAPIAMTTTAFLDTPVKTAAGGVEHKLVPMTHAAPGDVIVYVLTVRNTGSAPADRLVLNDPIAKGTEYLGPREGPAPMASVDGGKVFAPLPQLTVHGSDGSTRSAVPGDVTSLRWVLPTAVPAGGEGHVSFAAKLK